MSVCTLTPSQRLLVDVLAPLIASWLIWLSSVTDGALADQWLGSMDDINLLQGALEYEINQID